MGMLIPLGLGLSITRREREMKLLFGFMTAIMAVSLFLSLSRGGIASFCAGIALFTAFMLQREKGQRKVWIIVIFVIFVLSYVVYLGIDPVIERFYKTDISHEQRLAVWSGTWNAIRDFWLTGSGLGTFINIFPLYSLSSLSEVYDHAHNDYLEFFLETGLIGTILLLAFVATMIYAVIKASFRGRKGILLAAALSSGFTMVVHSIFDFNLHILSNLLLFASVLGMVAGLSESEDNEERDKVPEEEIRDNTIREDTSWLMASRPESRRKGPAQGEKGYEDVPEGPETERDEHVPEDREGATWEGEKGT
jgi:O-antigen ligase